ncbi:MAG TPA: hypothetical protein VFQ43_00910, partial [Nitrososphaera sp.]|nr:hypothetical protein [Nitrososphaera sp.]
CNRRRSAPALRENKRASGAKRTSNGTRAHEHSNQARDLGSAVFSRQCPINAAPDKSRMVTLGAGKLPMDT